jgi:hypothetical protein
VGFRLQNGRSRLCNASMIEGQEECGGEGPIRAPHRPAVASSQKPAAAARRTARTAFARCLLMGQLSANAPCPNVPHPPLGHRQDAAGDKNAGQIEQPEKASSSPAGLVPGCHAEDSLARQRTNQTSKYQRRIVSIRRCPSSPRFCRRGITAGSNGTYPRASTLGWVVARAIPLPMSGVITQRHW